MTILIIAEWDDNLNPTKVNQKETQAEVDQWLADNAERYPNAITGPHPGTSNTTHITVDPDAKTFTHDAGAEAREQELNEWKRQMEQSDQAINARTVEDIFEAFVAGDKSLLSKQTKDKMELRKQLRSRKPT